MQEITFEVEGMSCGGCEQKLQAALDRLETVRRASADHRSGRVTAIVDDPQRDREPVRSRIEEAGYEVSS